MRRTVRVKHGKVLTPHRLRLLDDYKRSRRGRVEACRLPTKDYWAFRAWVDGYERFMCKGWDLELQTYGHATALQDAQQHDPGVQPTDTQLDNRVHAGDAST